MAALLNSSTTIRRFAVLAVVFTAVLLFLRVAPTRSTTYLPSPQWQSSADNVNSQLSQPPPGGSVPNSSPRSRLSLDAQEYLSWEPPVDKTEHYPSYGGYSDTDFDPNRWEAFELNLGVFERATLSSLSSADLDAAAYLHYPKYNDVDWQKEWRGTYTYCQGPKGGTINSSEANRVWAYRGVPRGFPQPDVGSYSAVGLDGNVCFDRYARLGPYGVGGDEPKSDESLPNIQRESFKGVKWGMLQNDCLERNSGRFSNSTKPYIQPGSRPPLSHPDPIDVRPRTLATMAPRQAPALGGDASTERFQPGAAHAHETSDNPSAELTNKKYKDRTAVLIRTWDTYDYQENDIQAIRSMIYELSLMSGGEYSIFLFVNLKDKDLPIFTDPAAYDDALRKFVPEELHDIAVLWTEAVCEQLYEKVTEHSVYFQQFMPVQWFSQTHPEFEYIWNWEMDARYIGQHYYFLEQIAKFSRNQPRKYLWERNSRFYIPEVHGSYKNFTESTNRIVARSPWLKRVWGAMTWTSDMRAIGPAPPTSEEKDNFEWGVGEEADLITLLPVWDPAETAWSYRDKLWGYPTSPQSTEEVPYPHVPRRTFINTLARFSKRQLSAMHLENTQGRSMASEMWPASAALHHSLKVVYAPHPIWLSTKWPAEYIDLVFNADGWGAGSLKSSGDVHTGRGRAFDANLAAAGKPQAGTGPNKEGASGRWSAENDSVYSPDREHNFAGWSWYFWSDFPKVIYWRWLGWAADSFSENTGSAVQSEDPYKNLNWTAWELENGRMCLPGMLLHPVKNVRSPREITAAQ